MLGALLVGAVAAASPAFSHPPYALPVDASGNVYFSDLEAVWRLAPGGRLSLFRPGTENSHVHELAIAPDGALEGDLNRYEPSTERYFSGLWRRTMDGRETRPVPLTESAPAGFGVWQDGRGNRYASHWPSNEDRRTMLTRRTPDGRAQLVFAVGRPTPARHPTVESVGPMAFAGDGSVFFADGAMLRRLGPDGKVSLVYRGTGESSLRGLAMAPDGRVLAADMGARSIVAIGAEGRAETLYRERAEWLPTAVAAPQGRLLVLEANADYHDYVNRVRVVEVKDGDSRVVAAPGAEAAAQPAAAAADFTGGNHEQSGWATAIIVAAVAALAAGAALLALRRRRQG
jgi:hypothetical protein